ncbi:hypothetical protein ABN028_32175 [Actinopolymorpha sp. B17G11]|uniref:hypothetical protein n=1 Tax=Actinopolymorpha sp. B17G11 TaxID=3160861 RepID=UPI0032E4A064
MVSSDAVHRQALAGPDVDGYSGPARVVGAQVHGQKGLGGRVRCHAVHLAVSGVLAEYHVAGGERAERLQGVGAFVPPGTDALGRLLG